MSVNGDGRRAVVYGGAGFLGSFVADALSEAGFRVVIFDQIESPYLRGDQEGIVGDVLDASAVEAAADGASVIYNFAGVADIEAASRDPIAAVRANILGNTFVLEAARKARIERYIFASTVYVYSTAGGFYRSTKQACELIIEDYQRSFGVPYTILRYGSLYGPRAGETNWIWSMLKDAVLKGRIHRSGDGDEIREYIHVWDAARSSVDVLAPEFSNTQVIISGQQPMRIRDLLSMVQTMLGGRVEIDYLPTMDDGAGDGENLHYHISPYAFKPKLARRILRTSYVDLGQGLLDLMHQLYRAEHDLADGGGAFVDEALPLAEDTESKHSSEPTVDSPRRSV